MSQTNLFQPRSSGKERMNVGYEAWARDLVLLIHNFLSEKGECKELHVKLAEII